MALVKCNECGGKVSTQAATCPSCGAPVVATQAVSRKSNKFKWIIGLLAVAVVSAMVGMKEPSNYAEKHAANRPASTGMTMSDALSACQITMRKLSKDPDKAEIPFVQGALLGEVYTFAWNQNTKMMRMRNGIGLDVATTGQCAVNKDTQKLVLLKIGDQAFTQN